MYWIPLFQVLEERGFDVKLVDARQLKRVPGRKSDVADCQWAGEGAADSGVATACAARGVRRGQ